MINTIKRFKMFVEELSDRQKAGFSSYVTDNNIDLSKNNARF